jgi:hypothetical protein
VAVLNVSVGGGGGNLLYGGQPSRLLIAGVFVTSVVLIYRMQGVLCAAIWCLFPVKLCISVMCVSIRSRFLHHNNLYI